MTAAAASEVTDRRTGPLTGIRVLVLGGIGPVPFAAMLLADLGADVVRVDRPEALAEEGDRAPRTDLMNRGSRSIGIDLGHPDAVELIGWLAERANVVIEGFRPGVCERLGIGPDVLMARNPALVIGRQTGWGQDGPLAPRAGHDITYIARAGALHAIGVEDDPVVPLNLVADFGGGGVMLTVGVLAALLESSSSGRGQVVDSAMVDGANALMTMFHGMLAAGTWDDRRGVNLIDGGEPFYTTYRTRDGRHVAVGALEPKFFEELCTRLGLEDVPDRSDPVVRPNLRQRLASRFLERTRDEWADVFRDSDACVAPVLTLQEAPHDPHLVARGSFVEVGGVVQPNVPLRFGRTRACVDSPPPVPGADGPDVLEDWAGPGDRAAPASEALVAPTLVQEGRW